MLWWAAETTIIATALAGLVVVVSRVGRVSPAVRHVLWLLVLVKLTTPPLCSWPWAMPRVQLGAQRGSAVQAKPGHDTRGASGLNMGHMVMLGSHTVVDGRTLETGTFAANADVMRPGPGAGAPSSLPGPIETLRGRARGSRTQAAMRTAVLRLWLLGSIVAVTLHLARLGRIVRRLKHAQKTPAWLEQHVAEAATRLGVRRPRTAVVAGPSTPFVWTLGRPTLVFAAKSPSGLDRAAWSAVIVHELAHLRRRDHWVGWWELAASCLWWWNPLFWYVRCQMRENAELACDAWVLKVFPNQRFTYAKALVAVCQSSSRLAAKPAMGVCTSSRRAFERRLKMILSESVRYRVPWSVAVAAMILGLLAIPAWSQPAPREPASAKDAGGQAADAVPSSEDANDASGDSDTDRNTMDASGESAQKPAERGVFADFDNDGDVDIFPHSYIDPDMLYRNTGDGTFHHIPVAPDTYTLLFSEKLPGESPRERRLRDLIDKLEALLKDVRAIRTQGNWNAVPSEWYLPYAVNQAGTVTTWHRATYTLPPEKARALQNFLTIMFGPDRVEFKASADDELTITTSAEIQNAIGQLIKSMPATAAEAHSSPDSP